MANLNSRKGKRIFASIVAIILVLAMIIPTIIGIFM